VRQRTWFIGSRRRYQAPLQGGTVQRIDPAQFRSGSPKKRNRTSWREYELEVLERVIADIRDPNPDGRSDEE
jgi:hypothetical protein